MSTIIFDESLTKFMICVLLFRLHVYLTTSYYYTQFVARVSVLFYYDVFW